MSSKTLGSTITAVVNDIHFPHHDKKVWGAFKSWAKAVRPKRVVVLGDFVDLAACSRFPKSPYESPYIDKELRLFIKEINWLVSLGIQVDIVSGNHEARYEKKIAEAFGFAAKGLVGLTLKEQLFQLGLDSSINYYTESTKWRGLHIGQFLLRHGDKQARSVGAKNLASLRLDKSLGESELVAHHHTMQYVCRTNGNRIAMSIVSPCMTVDHEYAVGNQWVRGFTILEEVSANFVTPYPVVIHEGKFSYGGKVYSYKA